jgi:hypothetical protein
MASTPLSSAGLGLGVQNAADPDDLHLGPLGQLGHHRQRVRDHGKRGLGRDEASDLEAGRPGIDSQGTCGMPALRVIRLGRNALVNAGFAIVGCRWPELCSVSSFDARNPGPWKPPI